MFDCYPLNRNECESNKRLSALVYKHEKAEILRTVTNPNASLRFLWNLTPVNASWFMGHRKILRCVKLKQIWRRSVRPSHILEMCCTTWKSLSPKTDLGGRPNSYRVNIVIHFHWVFCVLDFFQTTLRLFTSFYRHCLHGDKSKRHESDDHKEWKVEHFVELILLKQWTGRTFPKSEGYNSTDLHLNRQSVGIILN